MMTDDLTAEDYFRLEAMRAARDKRHAYLGDYPLTERDLGALCTIAAEASGTLAEGPEGLSLMYFLGAVKLFKNGRRI